MTRVTLQLDAETARELREAAQREGLSQSEWVAQLIKAQLPLAWPEAVKGLAGAWRDLPEAEALRKQQGEDIPRESL